MTRREVINPARSGQQGSVGMSSPTVLPSGVHANAVHADATLKIYLFLNLEPSIDHPHSEPMISYPGVRSGFFSNVYEQHKFSVCFPKGIVTTFDGRASSREIKVSQVIIN